MLVLRRSIGESLTIDDELLVTLMQVSDTTADVEIKGAAGQYRAEGLTLHLGRFVEVRSWFKLKLIETNSDRACARLGLDLPFDVRVQRTEIRDNPAKSS